MALLQLEWHSLFHPAMWLRSSYARVEIVRVSSKQLLVENGCLFQTALGRKWMEVYATCLDHSPPWPQNNVKIVSIHWTVHCVHLSQDSMQDPSYAAWLVSTDFWCLHSEVKKLLPSPLDSVRSNCCVICGQNHVPLSFADKIMCQNVNVIWIRLLWPMFTFMAKFVMIMRDWHAHINRDTPSTPCWSYDDLWQKERKKNILEYCEESVMTLSTVVWHVGSSNKESVMTWSTVVCM